MRECCLEFTWMRTLASTATAMRDISQKPQKYQEKIMDRSPDRTRFVSSLVCPWFIIENVFGLLNWVYFLQRFHYTRIEDRRTPTPSLSFPYLQSFDLIVSMPGFEPLPALLRLLRRLWPLLRQILLITSLSLPPALAFTLRKLIGARR